MSKTETITFSVDTLQLEKAIKLTKELLALQKKLEGHPIQRGRTLDKLKGRTL